MGLRVTRGRPPTLRVVLYCLMFVSGAVVLIGGLVTAHAYLITGGLVVVAGAVIIVTAAGRLDGQPRE